MHSAARVNTSFKSCTAACLGSCQRSLRKFFVKIVNDFKDPLIKMPMIKTPKSSQIFFAKSSIMVVKQGSKYGSLVR